MANFKLNKDFGLENPSSFEDTSQFQINERDIYEQQETPGQNESETSYVEMPQMNNNFTSGLLPGKLLRRNVREKLAGNLLQSNGVVGIVMLLSLVFIGLTFTIIFKASVITFLIALILILIFIFVSEGVSAGLYSYFINLHNHNRGNISDLFGRFSNWWGYFKVDLLKTVKTFLWALIPLAGPFLAIKASLSYSMAPYIYLENTDKTARECIAESKRITEGNKVNLLIFLFGYIGWYLLTGVTMYIFTLIPVMIGMLSQKSSIEALESMNSGADVNLTGQAALDFMQSLLHDMGPSIILYVLSVSMLMFILVTPLISYAFMGITEAYYNLKEGNSYQLIPQELSSQSKKEKILLIIITVGLAIVLSIATAFTSAGMMQGMIKGFQKLPQSEISSDIESSKWTCDDDGSYLAVEDDIFMWYKSKDTLDKNYIRGNLKVYTGTEAKRFLLEDKTDLGLNEEEINRLYGEDLDSLRVWYIDNLEIKAEEDVNNREYIAYLELPNSEGKLHLINMLTASQYTFSPYIADDNTVESTKKTEQPSSIKDEKPNTESTTKTDNRAKSNLSISYTLPEGYKQSDSYDSEYFTTLYFDNDNYEQLEITEDFTEEAIDVDEEFYEDIKDHTTKNGIKGKSFKGKGYDFYYFKFNKGGKSYEVSGMNQSDFIKLIDSIK